MIRTVTIELLKTLRYCKTQINEQAVSYFGNSIRLTTFHRTKGLESKVVLLAGVMDEQYQAIDHASDQLARTTTAPC